jgi:rare lipoprotein A (peptidoglycan hydrolase)
MAMGLSAGGHCGKGRRLASFAVIGLCAVLLAACGNAPKSKKRGFSPSEYGVAASKRVVEYGQPVPRGGGRDMVGQPYVVRGRVYRPAVDENYSKVGIASWYGDDFHGRYTANGEIYDMDSLSAAHPTMPLPSYARVTNLANGRSVLVRVNDRGPYAGDRIIDLSAKAADMLDLKGAGVGRVKVQYAGRARLDGQDEAMLMASYRGPASGRTMVADNSRAVTRASAVRTSSAAGRSGGDVDGYAYGGNARSARDPISSLIGSSMRSYAESPVPKRGVAAIEDLVGSGKPASTRSVVHIGTFASAAEAERVAARLADFGDVELGDALSGGRPGTAVWMAVETTRVNAVIAAANKAGAYSASIAGR